MTNRRQRQRRRRLGVRLAQRGIAAHCDLAFDAPLPRWALVEIYTGPGTKGPWWTLGDDWGDLLRESADQLHASDWPAARLFDLDSEFSTAITAQYRPARPPADLRDARRASAPWSRWRPLRHAGARHRQARMLILTAGSRSLRSRRPVVGVAARRGRDHEADPR
jgi:hypothetical protein